MQAVFDNNNTTVEVNNTTYNPLKGNLMVIEDNYLTKMRVFMVQLMEIIHYLY